jgi:opacity protein-like surface antigen
MLVPVFAFAEPDPTPSSPPASEPAETASPAIATPPTPTAPLAQAKEPASTVTDADLSALGLDPAQPDDHLIISGFADFGWRALLMPSRSLGASLFPKENSFVVGNINLYVTKNLSSRWRSMLELRFLYAPAGTKNVDGTFTHTTATNAAGLERSLEWGGVSIERVYLEYEVNEWLTVQAGSFLTPYGIWNVDHGSPAIIPVTRPYIIGESLFPQQQTGLHLYGKRPFGKYQVGYHATLTNGRGPFQAFRDLDYNKAIGGRLDLETPWLDGVQLGVSGYRGRFTDRPADVIGVDASGTLINTTPAGTSYDEVSWGADVLVRRGGLHVQAEVIGNDRHYLAGAREVVRGGFAEDGRYLGAYAVAGYRFDRWWQVMPFAVLELDRMRSSAALGHEPTAYQATAGLNFRPDPSVVLKLEYIQVHVDAPLLDMDFRAFMSQAAWAF